MNISYAVDANYLTHAAASIQSILNHHVFHDAKFWIITTGNISNTQWSKALGALLPNPSIQRIEIQNQFAKFGSSQHHEVTYVSEAMYLRIQVPHVIPDSIERVLYLDADVICTSNGLEDLFDVDLGGNVLGAVRDPVTARLCDDNGIPFLSKYSELDPLAFYFNSGVLLIDTAAYREAGIRNACALYLQKTASHRRYPDQDALNIACHGRWMRLNKRWNHMRSERLDTFRADNLSQACLVHVTNKIKPWDSDFPPCRRRSIYENLRAQIDKQLSGQAKISAT